MRHALLTSVLLTASTVTLAAAPQRRRSPATLDSTTSFALDSRFTHETYRIKIYIPRTLPPAKGYPSLYLLDGSVLVATFAGAERNESQAGELEPAVVVGIESGDGSRSANRMYDFTAADLTPYEKKSIVEVGEHARFGGCNAFLKTIQHEVGLCCNHQARTGVSELLPCRRRQAG